MKREYEKPSMIVTSFETIDITSIELMRSAMISPKQGSHTTRTFQLHQ